MHCHSQAQAGGHRRRSVSLLLLGPRPVVATVGTIVGTDGGCPRSAGPAGSRPAGGRPGRLPVLILARAGPRWPAGRCSGRGPGRCLRDERYGTREAVGLLGNYLAVSFVAPASRGGARGASLSLSLFSLSISLSPGAAGRAAARGGARGAACSASEWEGAAWLARPAGSRAADPAGL